MYRLKDTSSVYILKRALEYYASKSALDIDTLGEKNVEAIVDAQLVTDIADIYELTVAQLVKLERFGKVSAQKLVDAISNSKEPSLERFISALGIRHVGQQTAIDLANSFQSVEALSVATPDELLEIDGIGEIVAESILAWFADDDNITLLEKFKRLGVKPVYVKQTGPLNGQNFVITGTLVAMSRDEAARQINAMGGLLQSAVSRSTNYLVVGEKVGESKIKKAKSYGTTVIDEQAFQDLLK